MIERYSHKNMAFILIEVQTKRGFLRPLFSISLSRLSVLLVADIGQGTHPCTFGVCFDDQRLRQLSQKRLPVGAETQGFWGGEKKNAAVFSKLDLCCGTKRKERSGKKSFALLWLRMQNKSTIYNSSSAARGISRSIPLPLSASLCPLAHNGEFIRLDPPSWAFASAFLSFFAALSCVVVLGSSF